MLRRLRLTGKSSKCRVHVRFSSHSFIDDLISVNRKDGFVRETGPPPVKRNVILSKDVNETVHHAINRLRDLPGYSFLNLSPPRVLPLTSVVPKANKAFWLRFASYTKDKSDLLEGWRHISRDRGGAEAEEQLQQEDLDKFLSNMCSVLDQFSYWELREITFSLTLMHSGNYGHDSDCLQDFSCLLDHTMAAKIPQHLESSQDSVSECLETAYIWLKYGLLSAPQRDAVSIKDLRRFHNSQLCQALMIHRIRDLSPPQLVFVLLLCGLDRVYPSLDYDNVGNTQGHALPDPLYDKLADTLPALTDAEVGLVCHSLHQMYVYLETRHARVRNSLLARLLNWPEERVGRDNFLIGCIAKFLKRRGTENREVVLKILQKYQPQLEYFEHYTSIRLLQMSLTAKPPPAVSESFVRSLLRSTGDLGQLRLKDLEQLAFCLMYLCDADRIRPIFISIKEAMTRCDWANVRSGRSFVYLVTHLARASVYDVPSIQLILEEVNKCDLSDLDSDLGLANAMEFLFRLNIPFVHDISANSTYVSKFINRNRILCRNSLFQVLELDTITSIYNLPLTVRLSATNQRLLSAYFGGESVVNLDAVTDKRGQLQAASFHGQTLNFVYRDLVQIMGDESHVHLGFPLPHSTSPSCVLTVPARRIASSRTELVDSVRSGSIRYKILMVPKKGEIGRDSTLYGSIKSQNKHLQDLGHSVSIVDWVEYFSALKRRRNLQYLRNIIYEKYLILF